MGWSTTSQAATWPARDPALCTGGPAVTGRARVRTPAAVLCLLCLLCLAGCAADVSIERPIPSSPAAQTVAGASSSPGDPAGLTALLPPPPAALSPELSTALSSVSELLVQQGAGLPPAVGDSAKPQAREKIEAYFDDAQRFEDDYRVRATELVAVLMAGLSGESAEPAADLVRHVLSAIVLEDQGALGFGVPGALPSKLPIAPEHLAEELVRPRVHYAALSAQAYARCEALATTGGWEPWRSLCAAGTRRMQLRAAVLPACSDDSLIDGTQGASQPTPGKQARGLLLNGSYDVPLLGAEIDKVLARARRKLDMLLDTKLRSPASATQQAPAASSCAQPPRPSEQLFAQSSSVEWLGLSLYCQGETCGLSACSHGDAGCFSAPLEGDAWALSAWLKAVDRLARSQGGPLIESAQIESAQTSVGLEAVAFHGRWMRQADAKRALSSHLPRLIACQREERYGDEWLLDVDRAGRIRGARASSPAHPYPMDEQTVASASARQCVGEQLRELRLPRGKGVRRLSLSLHIPASLQIELPLTLRHTRRMGPQDTRERLARDGFAVGIARCMAGAELTPRAIGVCARVTPDGRVGAIDLDLSPLQSPRAVVALAPAAAPVARGTDGPSEVQRCLAEVLDGLDWSCREGGQVGHVAATLQLPRALLERF